MDAFEEIISQLLEENGYWVKRSVKINLTSKEKKKIGKPTTPRPEIDIAALNLKQNKLYLLEVKSFLDSKGVVYEAITEHHAVPKGRYKLLTSLKYRNAIKKQLKKEFINSGFIKRGTKISFGLVAGNVHQNKEKEIKEYCDKCGWLFWGPNDIVKELNQLSEKGYENNAVTMVTKLLNRYNV